MTVSKRQTPMRSSWMFAIRGNFCPRCRRRYTPAASSPAWCRRPIRCSVAWKRWRSSAFVDIGVEELLLRRYKPVPERLRPEDEMVAHTGYLVFARSIAGRARPGPLADQGTTSISGTPQGAGGDCRARTDPGRGKQGDRPQISAHAVAVMTPSVSASSSYAAFARVQRDRRAL